MKIDYNKHEIYIEMCTSKYPHIAQQIRLILKNHNIFVFRHSEYFTSYFNSKMIIKVNNDDFEQACFILKLEEQNIIDSCW